MYPSIVNGNISFVSTSNCDSPLSVCMDIDGNIPNIYGGK